MEKVLIINPNPLARNQLMRSLTDAGFIVIEAVDGDEAIRAADLYGTIDLVIAPYPLTLDVCQQIAKTHTHVRFLLTSQTVHADEETLRLPAFSVRLLDDSLSTIDLIDEARNALKWR